MAFNPVIQPRAGELMLRGAEGMAATNSRASRALGGALDRIGQDHKAYKAMVALAPSYGIPKEQAEMMGAAKLSGMLRGKVYEEEKARREEESAYRKATLDKLRVESVRNVEERRAEEKIGRGLNDYFYQGPAGIAANRPVNRDTLAQWAVQQPGALQSENVRRLMQYAPEAPPAPWTPSVMDVPQMPGYKFVQTGPSGGGSVYNLNPPPSRGAEVTWKSGDPALGTPGSYSVGGANLAEVRRLVAEIEAAGGQPGPGPVPAPAPTAAPGNGEIVTSSGARARIKGGTVDLRPPTEEPPAAEVPPPVAPTRSGPGMAERIDMGLSDAMAPVRRFFGTDAPDPAVLQEKYQGQKAAILQGGFTPGQKEQLLRALVQRYAPALQAAGLTP